METGNYQQIRRRFVSAVTIIVLVLALLIYWHIASKRTLLFFSVESAICILLLTLIVVFSYFFLHQVRMLEQVNLKLRSQQEDLQLKSELLDAASDAILLLDVTGQFVYFNTTLQAMSGYSSEELHQIGLHGIQPPEYAARILTNINNVLERGEAFFESAYLQKNGSILPIEVHARRTDINGRTLILSIARDISERKKIEQTLITSIKGLEKAEHSALVRSKILEQIASGDQLATTLSFIASSIEQEHPDMLCSILLVSDDGKRLLVGAAPSLPGFYNKAAHRTKIGEGIGSCGTAAFRRERVIVEDINDHQFWKGFVPAQEAGLRSCWSEPIISSTGQLLGTFAIYHRTPAKPGDEEIFLIEQAALFACLAIEHSRVDQELRSSEERYRTLVNNLPVVVWEADETTAATFISRRVEQVYGFTQEEMYAAGPDLWAERIHEDDRQRVTDAYAAFFTGECVFDEEFRIRRKDGEWVWLHDFAYAITTRGNEKIAYGVFADITARKQAEFERDELEHMLSQSQKMEAIGHLAGGIAHDFNNLLTPILIYSDMLKRSLPDNEKAKSQLEGIVKASGKARDLTQQLLSFGRKQVMQMKVIDLNEIIMSFHSMVRRILRENISLTLQLASQPAVVLGDSGKIEQALLNLVLNAQEAITVNGSITIETGHVLIDDEFIRRHPDMISGQYVQMTFTDTGCGMNTETIERIFEPFFSTKELGHGTGLGLANVYGIVKQHNGYIMAVSTVGAGTTFKIYLPVSDETPKISGAEDEQAPLDYSDSAVILLVEDNEMVRVMTCELLEGFGYTVYSADQPERAIEILKENAVKIDLVITDVVMPGMNGQQLYERINSDYPEIDKVLYISGYTNNVIVSDNDLGSGQYFLQKPFTVDALMLRVKELLQPDDITSRVK